MTGKGVYFLTAQMNLQPIESTWLERHFGVWRKNPESGESEMIAIALSDSYWKRGGP